MSRDWSRREALGFAAGSACFAVGVLAIYVHAVGVRGANLTLFVGSLLFTGAAAIQLALALRARRQVIGTVEGADPGPTAADLRAARDDAAGSTVQCVGTLCFNVSTAVAVWSHADRTLTLEDAWRPDAVGSLCFLIASALALAAAARRGRRWRPRDRDWWAGWLNAGGSVAFAVAAAGAYVAPLSGRIVDVRADDLGTIVGACCFLAAALATWPRR